MKKLPYQGGLTKLIASAIAGSNKRAFARYIEKSLPSLKKNINLSIIPLDLVSFSSGNDFYEQNLSILSFLRYVGTPVSWTLYSDGSHSQKQIDLISSSFEFVKVKIIDWENASTLPGKCKEKILPYLDFLLDYAKKQPLGKRLLLYLNHEIIRPTLFLDSDILFYDQGALFNIILEEKANGWYLPEVDWGCLDSRYVESNTRQLYQVNGGFLLFNKNLTDFSEGLEFLKSLNYSYEYFSEQTVMHILLKANGFMPLDPRIFILNTDDQFDFSYVYAKDRMAIRHYTGPVRHKMWQRNWKWQLSIS